MFLGLDCSTQSLSAIIIDAEKGTIEHEEVVRFQNELPQHQTTHGFVRGAHPDEFFSSPLMWLDALDLLCSKLVNHKIPLHLIKGISGSAQQHATVYVKHDGQKALHSLDPNHSLSEQLRSHYSRPVCPIWLDASTGEECKEIANTVGGNKTICNITGSSITPRFSAAQIRKYAKQYPARWAETETVHLASSYFSSIMAGHQSAIDYGDGAGMNLMNLNKLQWDETMAHATFEDLIDKLPPLQHSANLVGLVNPYFVKKYGFNERAKCYNWSGDNPCSLVGMGAAKPGKWIISLGTSYTVFCATEAPVIDPNGFGNVFGNPIHDYMALSCFKNGALACFTLKDQLGIDWLEFDTLAQQPPSLNDKPSLPFFETEITPRHKSTDQTNTTVRSLLDGQFLNMKHHSAWMASAPECIYVTGGISQSNGVCQTIANIFQTPVHRLDRMAQLNVECDRKARHWAETTTNTTSKKINISGRQWELWINDRRVIHQIDRTIRSHIHDPQMKQRWADKGKVSQNNIQKSTGNLSNEQQKRPLNADTPF